MTGHSLSVENKNFPALVKVSTELRLTTNSQGELTGRHRLQTHN